MNPEVESTIATVAQKTAYAGGAGGGVLAWLTSDIIFGIIGVLIALVGTLVGAHYKRKADRRIALLEAEESEMRRREDARKAELHAARMAFFRRAEEPGPSEMVEARLLGIDTSDFGQLDGVSDGR